MVTKMESASMLNMESFADTKLYLQMFTTANCFHRCLIQRILGMWFGVILPLLARVLPSCLKLQDTKAAFTKKDQDLIPLMMMPGNGIRLNPRSEQRSSMFLEEWLLG